MIERFFKLLFDFIHTKYLNSLNITAMIENKTIMLFHILSDIKDKSSFNESCIKISLTILTLICDSIVSFIQLYDIIFENVENYNFIIGPFEIFKAFKIIIDHECRWLKSHSRKFRLEDI